MKFQKCTIKKIEAGDRVTCFGRYSGVVRCVHPALDQFCLLRDDGWTGTGCERSWKWRPIEGKNHITIIKKGCFNSNCQRCNFRFRCLTGDTKRKEGGIK